MSKMGISVVDSYRGAHLFDILGLHKSVVDRCFPGTPAPLFQGSGSDLREASAADVAAGCGLRRRSCRTMAGCGFARRSWPSRMAGSRATVKALQTVVGSTRAGVVAGDPAAAFAILRERADSREPAVLRDLLAIRPAGAALALDEVESARASVQAVCGERDVAGQSLSPEAHQCITIAMNTLGGRSNTGEGGEDREVYRVRLLRRWRMPSGGGAMQAGGTAVAEMPLIRGGASDAAEQQDQAGGFRAVWRDGGVPGACG